MPHYLVQFSFATVQVKGLVDKPQDREAAARQVVEAFGGRLECYYFMFGEFDGVGIAEFPDNESAAGFSMRVGSSGAFAAFQTHALLTAAEGQRAMEKAKSTGGGYRPPAG
ncbi:GYD domain-containing protein [Roseomonas sp. HF4]|uniref:GYD domain-containing protein n=1 Tax=Roseomonas sp. HF4 TaxID=2562313 RepID=UPI001484CBBC|nr:GYD domain-containing protein [Roseomonas sp. HF4]